MNPALELSKVSLCRKCVGLGKDHVPAAGNPRAEIMVIGQSPGADEVEQGQPFVGPCGELLNYMLDEAGFAREDVYITNTLKCHPPGNRPGHLSEIKHCRKTWLVNEILSVKPLVILVLGKDAYTSVCPQDEKFDHKKKIYNKKLNCYFVLSYHPGFFLRNRTQIEEFISVGQFLRSVLEEVKPNG